MLANPAIKSQSGDIPRASFQCPWSAKHGVKRQHCSVTLPLQVEQNCPSGLKSAKSTRKGDRVTWQSWFWWKIARRCCKHIPERSSQISVMAYVCSIHASITRVTYTLRLLRLLGPDHTYCEQIAGSTTANRTVERLPGRKCVPNLARKSVKKSSNHRFSIFEKWLGEILANP